MFKIVMNKKLTILLSVFLVAFIFVIDLITPLGYAAGILYSIPLFIILGFHRRKTTYVLIALTFSILVVLAVFFKPPFGVFFILPVTVFNRIAIIINIIILIYDSFYRNKADEALKKSERRYRAIFEGSNDPITVLDLDPKEVKYVDVNERYCELSGYTKAEILATKAGTDISPDHLRPKIVSIFERIRNEKGLIYEWEIRRKTGEFIPVQVSSRAVELEGKLYAYNVFRDMRLIKQAEEVLKRDNATLEKLVKERTEALVKAKKLSEMGTLASTIAHELRNPLAAIQLGAYNIARKTTEKEKLEKHLRTIEKKVLESNQIIDNLLHFAKIKSPELKQVNLCEIIKESEQLAQGKYQKKEIQIIDNTPQIKDLYINGDPVQLQEVFSNILNNAFEALVERGRIEIMILEIDHTIKLIIKDNGPGIPPEIADRVFEPFVTTKSKGTGLGLAISKQIIENHNGTISLDSENGQGTAVTMMFPK